MKTSAAAKRTALFFIFCVGQRRNLPWAFSLYGLLPSSKGTGYKNQAPVASNARAFPLVNNLMVSSEGSSIEDRIYRRDELLMLSEKQEEEDKLRAIACASAEMAEDFACRLDAMRESFNTCLADMEKSHRVDLLQQGKELLKDMVPLAAHEAILRSSEEASSAMLAEAANVRAAELVAIEDEYTSQHELLFSEVQEKGKELGIMSADLEKLRSETESLRSTLSSQIIRAHEAPLEAESRIRQEEVEPQRLRAATAEASLETLRESAMGWLTDSHRAKVGALELVRQELEEEREAMREDLESRLREKEAEVVAARVEGAARLEELQATLRASHEGDLEAAEELHREEEARLELRLQATLGALEESLGSREQLRESFASYVTSAHEKKLAYGAAQRMAGVEEERGATIIREGALREAFASYVALAHEEKLSYGSAQRAAGAEEEKGAAGIREGALREAFASYVASAHEEKLSYGAVQRASGAEEEKGAAGVREGALREAFASYVASAHEEKLSYGAVQ
ncbi:unnamed protein product, partial [Discosporangium mesarthrocarpum]